MRLPHRIYTEFGKKIRALNTGDMIPSKDWIALWNMIPAVQRDQDGYELPYEVERAQRVMNESFTYGVEGRRAKLQGATIWKKFTYRTNYGSYY